MSSSSYFGFQKWTSIYEARRLLGIPNDPIRPSPTKEEIEIAFRNSAKKYHPDSISSTTQVQPCAIKFRQCIQARELLLEHHSSTHQRGGGGKGQQQQQQASHHSRNKNHSHYHRHEHYNRYQQQRHRNQKDYFGKGFPFQTLRLLTLKQKLMIRGSIMIMISLGALYDRWLRKQIQIQRNEQQQQQRLKIEKI